VRSAGLGARQHGRMADRPIGTVLQFAYDASDLPTLLRRTAEGIEHLGPNVEILEVVIRPDKLTAEIYFLRAD
jgi:hypothetical protein